MLGSVVTIAYICVRVYLRFWYDILSLFAYESQHVIKHKSQFLHVVPLLINSIVEVFVGHSAQHLEKFNELELIVLIDLVLLIFNSHLCEQETSSCRLYIDFQLWHHLSHQLLCLLNFHPSLFYDLPQIVKA